MLSVKQLCLTDSQRTLFQNIEFDLKAGELLAVMGPSGIGKSMLSKAIAGFLPNDIISSGSIYFNGADVTQKPMLSRSSEQRPAVVFQDALQALNPLVTVGQLLSLAYSSYRTRLNNREQESIYTLLTQLGFQKPDSIVSHYPSQLSGGQRQRICIALALLGKSNLIIADEPTSALDPITEQEILSLFRSSIRSRDIAGVLITHDLSAALASDKLIVIADSTMVAYGEPRAAIKQSNHPFCQQLAKLLD